MSYTLVLVEADEGTTGSIYVAQGGKADLIRMISERLGSAIADLYSCDDDRDFFKELEISLILMLENHQEWTPGRYEIEPIKPHWQKWTLVVADGEHLSPC